MRFLSPEWINRLDEVARADPELADAAAEADLVVQQVVVGGDAEGPAGGAGEVAYHVVLRAGEVAVRPGRADAPTVTFTQDRATAEAVAAGELSAQQAFIDGKVRLGGDTVALAERAKVLARVGDAFAAVRAEVDEG